MENGNSGLKIFACLRYFLKNPTKENIFGYQQLFTFFCVHFKSTREKEADGIDIVICLLFNCE